MGRQVESPRYNVISMRVSDEERESLQLIASQLSMSISEMLRRSLQHLSVEKESLQLHRGLGA